MKTYRRLVFGLMCLFCCNQLVHAQGAKITRKINDIDATSRDGYIQSLLSLTTVGEKINTFIRINKAAPYTAHLVFVERQDWPEHKQQQLRELYDGQGRGKNFGRSGVLPYPVKLRFQLDSVGASMPVHVEVIHDRRDLTYSTYYPDSYPKLPNGQPGVIWRAQGLWGGRNLEPGVYRIRIENLTPCSEMDFETLLQFYVNRHKA